MRFYRSRDTVVTIANPCYTGHHCVKGREHGDECTCPLKAHFAALVQELVYEHDRSCIALSIAAVYAVGALVHPFQNTPCSLSVSADHLKISTPIVSSVSTVKPTLHDL